MEIMSESNYESNYERLFGTVERAAETIAGIRCDATQCEVCPLNGAICTFDASKMLEWLESDSPERE